MRMQHVVVCHGETEVDLAQDIRHQVDTLEWEIVHPPAITSCMTGPSSVSSSVTKRIYAIFVVRRRRRWWNIW